MAVLRPKVSDSACGERRGVWLVSLAMAHRASHDTPLPAGIYPVLTGTVKKDAGLRPDLCGHFFSDGPLNPRRLSRVQRGIE
jgi:hypothetical protein